MFWYKSRHEVCDSIWSGRETGVDADADKVSLFPGVWLCLRMFASWDLQQWFSDLIYFLWHLWWNWCEAMHVLQVVWSSFIHADAKVVNIMFEWEPSAKVDKLTAASAGSIWIRRFRITAPSLTDSKLNHDGKDWADDESGTHPRVSVKDDHGSDPPAWSARTFHFSPLLSQETEFRPLWQHTVLTHDILPALFFHQMAYLLCFLLFTSCRQVMECEPCEHSSNKKSLCFKFLSYGSTGWNGMVGKELVKRFCFLWVSVSRLGQGLLSQMILAEVWVCSEQSNEC